MVMSYLQVAVAYCTYTHRNCVMERDDAEELWCVEAVHLVPSLGHWDTVSSSMTFSNPNHVLCMSSVGALRDETQGFLLIQVLCMCICLTLCCSLAGRNCMKSGPCNRIKISTICHRQQRARCCHWSESIEGTQIQSISGTSQCTHSLFIIFIHKLSSHTVSLCV